MEYSTVSKIKTYLGICILIFYFLKVTLIPVNKVFFLFGLLLFVWYVGEELYFFIKKIRTKSYFQIFTDFIFELIVVYFILRRLIYSEIKLFDRITFTAISLLIGLLIVLNIAKFIRKMSNHVQSKK